MDTENLTVTLLGTGTSAGVPVIGCDCPVCTSTDPRDQRYRCSALVSQAGGNIVIDTTPEFRLQCLRARVRRVDAVLITHAHADHIFGMDDLRRFNQLQQQPIPCFGNAQTIESLQRIFGYATVPNTGQLDRPKIQFHIIDRPIELLGMRVTPIPLRHGPMSILGYRIGDFAYCTDCSEIPNESFELLQSLKLLVLGALRPKPHPMHFSLSQAVQAAQKIGARQTLLIHMSHQLPHAQTNVDLPENIALAYDGQTVRLGDL